MLEIHFSVHGKNTESHIKGICCAAKDEISQRKLLHGFPQIPVTEFIEQLDIADFEDIPESTSINWNPLEDQETDKE